MCFKTCFRIMAFMKPKGTNVLKMTNQYLSMQPPITNNADFRAILTTPSDFQPQCSQAPQAFSEKIPEVWKNTNFSAMPFTIEKCCDLK